ncbi:MAG: asparagine synthase (glutamine-hydrolyzing) [Bdellovibrionales bacterium RIFOXYD12_FULL_39_22]|nr:MAG: asparagine synthase (glutamine-hydrolyzing) [Bdellovibrionales bacterium RIFOXYB1_FULL_39_21]OFZ42602.1 MAG: asparagine synthase (glutamine-hydrolyzing) [Bdellovibrionales bacterium RIFOXYC12_FULL_39_17]OFZ47130.1 MAG: asparagine synthase (glutamine-hydrolyzing) [Bdellovibrionales bacterium RIFOXYC1_FULL_39_130]OFZ75378.1 MAG: asparagine synthase (glutamine-hydrolyzing) [Bdellovibrionales bacterium RIFOXYD1_FULL_39_84]OFZ93329.1 MAG: asparagine synthase (glutamine-hydrolyzing) [Bdellovi
MCGIWGEFGPQVNFDRSKLQRTVTSLFHRGPDGFGYYSTDNCALVHTRLSIIDFATGGQPLVSYDKNVIGIVNGEIYDYQKIKKELQSEGVYFNTNSDSEVLLNLFVKKGISALKNIHGEYAYIFYDLAKKRVYFGRDPFGVKPLYILKKNNSIVLASEIKAILANETYEINTNYLINYICSFIPPMETLFQNIQHVYPDRSYEYDITKNRFIETALESLKFDQTRIKHTTKEEATYKLELALKNSVKRRLVADVEVGSYLSGGIDSALMLGLMCEQGARPKAFTVSFEDKQYDESHKAMAVAKHLGVKHEIVVLSQQNFFDHLGQSIVAFESPIINPHGAAKNLLSSLASKHLKVVLSGEGADELFAGYAHHRLNKLDRFLARHPLFAAEKVINSFIEKRAGTGSKYLCGKDYPFEAEIKAIFDGEYPGQFKRLINEKNARYLFGKEIKNLIASSTQKIKYLAEMDNITECKNQLSYQLWLDIRLDLLHYILANLGDRQEMSNSIEGRTPFLDLEVANLAMSYPANFLISGLTEKYLLKEISKKYLPLKNANESKHAFFAPEDYFKSKTGEVFLNSYLSDAKGLLKFLNWSKIDRLFQYTAGEGDTKNSETNTLKLLLASTSYLLQEIKKATKSSQKLQNSFSDAIIKGEPHVVIL